MDAYLERAIDERSGDYTVVRAWVFDQIERNLPQFAHDLACMLAGAPPPYPKGYDWRVAAAADVSEMRSRMSEAIKAQPATAALAERLREDDEEEEREAAIEAAREAAYARRCDESIPNIPAW